MDKDAKLEEIKGYVEFVESNYPLRIGLAKRGVIEVIGEMFSLKDYIPEEIIPEEIKGYLDRIGKILPDMYRLLIKEDEGAGKEDSENPLERDTRLAKEYRTQKKMIDEIKARLSKSQD